MNVLKNVSVTKKSASLLIAGVLAAIGAAPVWCADSPASSQSALGKWGGPPTEKMMAIIPPVRSEPPVRG